jgi:hypothetical protein
VVVAVVLVAVVVLAVDGCEVVAADVDVVVATDVVCGLGDDVSIGVDSGFGDAAGSATFGLGFVSIITTKFFSSILYSLIAFPSSNILPA